MPGNRALAASMVIEIALGIVLAVIILSCLPLILAAGLVVVGLGLLLGVVALGVAFWPKLLFLPPLIAGFAVPFAIFKWVASRFTWFRLALDGKPPYDKWRHVPLRFALTGPIVFSLVCLGLAVAMGATALLEPIYSSSVGK